MRHQIATMISLLHHPCISKDSLSVFGILFLCLSPTERSLASELTKSLTDSISGSVAIESGVDVIRQPDESGGTELFRESALEVSLTIEGESQAGDFQGIAELSVNTERESEPGTASLTQSYAELKQLWIQRSTANDGVFRVGLQEIEDDRGWWWDTEQWAAMIMDNGDSDNYWAMAAIAGSAEINTIDEPADPEQADIYRLMVHAGTDFGTEHDFKVYGLVTADLSKTEEVSSSIPEGAEDDSDATLVHLGLGWTHQTITSSFGSLNWRADLAFMRGRETNISYQDDDVNQALTVSARETTQLTGWAIDTGIELLLPLPGQPKLQFGYAVGSGTGAGDADGSQTFRQTGIHDNSQNSGLYGMVLEPQLSNVRIFSSALTFPVTEGGEISFFYHRFSRLNGADAVPDNALDLEIDSARLSIGSEAGIYVEYELMDQLEIEFSFARFQPGSAVSSVIKQPTQRASVELSWEF